MTGAPGRVFVRQGIGQRADGPFEVGQVFVHGGLQDGVGGIEIPVGEVVAHTGNLPPWDRWLGGQQVIREYLDGLADFQQADADGVEYQPVGQVPALQVGADRIGGGPVPARPAPRGSRPPGRRPRPAGTPRTAASRRYSRLSRFQASAASRQGGQASGRD
jgi:hypothetical protein